MISRYIRRNILGFIAIFIALGGMGIAAGLKKNSVKSKQIKDGQVLTQDIGDGAVGTADLGTGAVTGAKLAADSVDATKIGANALSGSDIDEASLVGLNAATLGGTAAGGFALAGHGHDATYVNEGQADSVTGPMIADTSRTIQLPLNSFIECDSDVGADINYTSGADRFPDFVNSATDGQGFVIRFDDAAGNEDEDTSICTQALMPADAISDGSIIIEVTASRDSGGAAFENVRCGIGVNGGAQIFTSELITLPPLTQRSCVPGGVYAPEDLLTISLEIASATAMDDFVDVHAVALRYSAIQ